MVNQILIHLVKVRQPPVESSANNVIRDVVPALPYPSLNTGDRSLRRS